MPRVIVKTDWSKKVTNILLFLLLFLNIFLSCCFNCGLDCSLEYHRTRSLEIKEASWGTLVMF